MNTTQTDQPSPLAPDETRPFLVAKPAPGGKGPSRRGWTEPDCTDRHEAPPETVPEGRKVWRVIGRAWAVLDADTAGTRQILAAVAPHIDGCAGVTVRRSSACSHVWIRTDETDAALAPWNRSIGGKCRAEIRTGERQVVLVPPSVHPSGEPLRFRPVSYDGTLASADYLHRVAWIVCVADALAETRSVDGDRHPVALALAGCCRRLGLSRAFSAALLDAVGGLMHSTGSAWKPRDYDREVASVWDVEPERIPGLSALRNAAGEWAVRLRAPWPELRNTPTLATQQIVDRIDPSRQAQPDVVPGLDLVEVPSDLSQSAGGTVPVGMLALDLDAGASAPERREIILRWLRQWCRPIRQDEADRAPYCPGLSPTSTASELLRLLVLARAKGATRSEAATILSGAAVDVGSWSRDIVAAYAAPVGGVGVSDLARAVGSSVGDDRAGEAIERIGRGVARAVAGSSVHVDGLVTSDLYSSEAGGVARALDRAVRPLARALGYRTGCACVRAHDATQLRMATNSHAARDALLLVLDATAPDWDSLRGPDGRGSWETLARAMSADAVLVALPRDPDAAKREPRKRTPSYPPQTGALLCRAALEELDG